MKEIYFDNSSTSFPKAEGVGTAMNGYHVVVTGMEHNEERGKR